MDHGIAGPGIELVEDAPHVLGRKAFKELDESPEAEFLDIDLASALSREPETAAKKIAEEGIGFRYGFRRLPDAEGFERPGGPGGE